MAAHVRGADGSSADHRIFSITKGLLYEARKLHATALVIMSAVSLQVPLPPLTRSPSPVSSGQRHPITLRLRLCSWDVFPYDLLPNQLRPFGLASWTGQQRGRLGLRHLSFPRQSGGSGERSEPIGALVQQSLLHTYSAARPNLVIPSLRNLSSSSMTPL